MKHGGCDKTQEMIDDWNEQTKYLQPLPHIMESLWTSETSSLVPSPDTLSNK
jgi:hypothetical protein